MKKKVRSIGNRSPAIKVSAQAKSPIRLSTTLPRRSLLATIKEHPLAVATSLILSFLVGAATVIPAVVRAFEIWNESIATIDMGAIDQKKPFSAPLDINDPSSVFDMHSPAVACHFSAVYSGGMVIPSGGTLSWHPLGADISNKSPAIFFCDVVDRFKYTGENGQQLTLQSATISVSVRYETWLGPFTFKREPPPTIFTAINTSSGYTWVKGSMIK